MAFVGEPAAPERFLVKVVVAGPASLGEPTVMGLEPTAFEVFVGDIAPENKANIITGAYVQGEYWLVAQAPSKTPSPTDPTLLFDINVRLGAVSDLQRSAVMYATIRRDQVVVIDKSGSMNSPLGSTKLDAAKNGARLFVDAAAEEDKLGVVCFSGDNVEPNNDAKTLHALADVAGARDAAKTQINGIAPDNMTAIGDGLNEAQKELNTNGDPVNHIQFIVLLSDGEQNEALFWGKDPDVKQTILDAGTIVHTIALGPETDQELMQDIAAQTGGNYYYVDVGELAVGATSLSRIAPMASSLEELPNRLADTFKSIDESILGHERLWFENAAISEGKTVEHKVEINDADVKDAIFAINWSKTASLDVTITRPNGTTVNSANPGVLIFKDSNHAVFQLDTLPQGTWNVKIKSQKGTTPYVASLSGKIIKGVKFDIFFAQLNTDNLAKSKNGLFLRRIPMPILGVLTDAGGPVRNANVDVRVEAPDGKETTLGLFDDGNHQDGVAGDGLYGNLYTGATIASQGGILEKDASAGKRGSYIVNATAEGKSNQGTKFKRLLSRSFHVFEFDTSREGQTQLDPDPDKDGMPTRWEGLHGLKPSVNDASEDPDHDNLPNLVEYISGTNPIDPDTDDGGEGDGSEVKRGSNPLNSTDDLIPRPIDAGVVEVNNPDEISVLPRPNSNLIRFPVNPAYKSILLFRTKDIKVAFQQVAEIDPVKFPGLFFDEGLENGVTYFYQIVAIGKDGANSAPSHIFSGTPKLDPISPDGDFTINDNAEITNSLKVKLKIDASPDVTEMRISNKSSFAGAKWEPFKAAKDWTVEQNPATSIAFVFLQLRDASLNESGIIHNGIRVNLVTPSPTPLSTPMPSPTPVPTLIPAKMILNKRSISMEEGEIKSISVQLKDKKNLPVPNWEVAATSSNAKVAVTNRSLARTNSKGVAVFNVIAVSSGNANIIFSAKPNLKQTLKVNVVPSTEKRPTPKPTQTTPTPTSTPPPTPVRPTPTPTPGRATPTPTSVRPTPTPVRMISIPQPTPLLIR